MAVDVKQLSRDTLEEAFGKGKLDYVDRLFDPSAKVHDALLGDLDVEGFKHMIQDYRSAFPDLTPTVLAICAEGDLVATYWRFSGTHRGAVQGIPATGKRVVVEGMGFDRYRAGRIVESWAQWDTLGFLQQLGVLPRMQQPSAQPAGAQPQPQP